ncbi:Cholesterol oxidase (EC @ Steroid Delta(5)-_Delta(4)-isomerase (EC [Olavius algarvensis associated proteobacterium Delta 3]|nr:Cholesterol oxidase (EC @ Steroid Delta(5)->Delta(4)-isomerase (EC [Olavius algarvensis associated proteobacterium Delta 3]CAB5165965.1 Cholesterol oxidase (EC @ Steroid Delta(5)->Delta(4)-isomerase (EC [Olavius algarvensis associated proteobacterium Delta 3]
MSASFLESPGKRFRTRILTEEARPGCTLCSACMTGCRDGGKNTLDKNYLYLAEQMGVQVLSETGVVAVRPQSGGYTLRARKSRGFRKPTRRFHSRGVARSDNLGLYL